MNKKTFTAEEVKEKFVISDTEKALKEIGNKVSVSLTYDASAEILANSTKGLSKEEEKSLSFLDKMCWVARQAYLEVFLQATRLSFESANSTFEKMLREPAETA